MVRTLLVSSFVLALTSVGATRSAYADSDGYYCIGPNYLAYQLSLGPEINGHVLYVVSLPDSGLVGRPTEVHLPDFQVHGMRCSASSVQLLGWDSLYTVHLSGARPSVTVEIAPWAQPGAPRQAPADYAQLNLGAWNRAARAGRPDTIAIGVQATAYRFLLSIDVRPSQRPCAYSVVTRLVQVDATSHVIAALKLFEGQAARECGH